MTGPALTADSEQESGGAQAPNLAARAAAAALFGGEGAPPAESPAPAPAQAPAPASPAPAREQRRRGRPPQKRPAGAAPPSTARPPAPAAAVISPAAVSEAQEAVADALVGLFALVAIVKGPAWNVTKERIRPASNPLGKGLAPYMPHIGEWLPFAVGGLALAGIVKECVDKDAQLKSKPGAGSLPSSSSAEPAPATTPGEFDGSPS